MKKNKLAAAAMLTSLLLGSVLTACGNTSEAQTDSASAKDEAEKTYVIAMDTNYAPFEFQQDGEWVGIDVELLKAVAEEENFKYEEKHMNFSGIIPALQANQVDASLAAMFINDKRKEVLDFSEGYFESGVGAFVKADSSIAAESDFTGKTVAVKKGETGAAWAEKNKAQYQLNIQYFDDAAALFQQVANGGAEIGMTDYPVVAYRITADANANIKMVGKFDPAYYGFAVPKGQNQELLQMFNDGIKKLKQSGKYYEIVKKYINV